MDKKWWVYDEMSEFEPGWQLWRVWGVFAASPSPMIKGQQCVLGSRASQHQAWLVDRGVLHPIEREVAWRAAHRRLLSPLPPGLKQRWIRGHAALARLGAESIESSLDFLTDNARDVRASTAPDRWGSAAAPSGVWSS